jgi:hypothetical protein
VLWRVQVFATIGPTGSQLIRKLESGFDAALEHPIRLYGVDLNALGTALKFAVDDTETELAAVNLFLNNDIAFEDVMDGLVA